MLANLIIAVWIFTAGLHLALLFVVVRSKPSFPWFAAFVWAVSGQNIGLLFLRYLLPAWFPAAYYTSAFLILSLLSGVAVEIFLSVYGSSQWRPPLVRANLWRLLALAYPACVVIGILLHARTKCAILNSIRTAEQIILAGLVATFWILARYSWRWGITWRQIPSGIVHGLLLCLTVDLVSIFINGHGGRLAAELGTIAWQCSYLGSLFIWLKCFSRPEKRVVLSPQLKARAYWKVAGSAQTVITATRQDATRMSPRKRTAYA